MAAVDRGQFDDAMLAAVAADMAGDNKIGWHGAVYLTNANILRTCNDEAFEAYLASKKKLHRERLKTAYRVLRVAVKRTVTGTAIRAFQGAMGVSTLPVVDKSIVVEQLKKDDK